MARSKKQGADWRAFVRTLTAAQRDGMLTALLQWQLDDLGGDGDVRFRAADPRDPDDPADIYWDSCGDSLVPGR